MSPGLHEGQETATYTQLATQKVEIKSPPPNKLVFLIAQMAWILFSIRWSKLPNLVFSRVVFMNESSVCVLARGARFCGETGSQIHFVKGLVIWLVQCPASPWSPPLVIICFCLCCLVSQSLCASERVTLFSKRVSLYLQRWGTHLPWTCRPRSTSAACSTDNGCVWPCWSDSFCLGGKCTPCSSGYCDGRNPGTSGSKTQKGRGQGRMCNTVIIIKAVTYRCISFSLPFVHPSFIMWMQNRESNFFFISENPVFKRLVLLTLQPSHELTP